jgi:transposase, IS6 family
VGGALVLPLRVSYRDLEEMLTERGVPVDHTTAYRGVQRYAPELDKQTRWYRRVEWTAQSWRVDETYIRIGGSGATCTERSPPTATPWTSPCPPGETPPQRRGSWPTRCGPRRMPDRRG